MRNDPVHVHRPRWALWRRHCAADGERWPCPEERQRRVTELTIRFSLDQEAAAAEAREICADGEAYARRLQSERMHWWARGAR